MHVVLNSYGHTLIKFTGKIMFVHEIGLICDHLNHSAKLLVTKREPHQFSLYTLNPFYRTTFKAPRGKYKSLLRMKLVTDVTLLFLSAV